ncbi:hypothetical protein [Demequina mangrovi]|uniref:Uncharacterized protein n=1 Tax=Demequina mangrovi TaxID=1043493 RepID=A0A1H6TQR2_9MICO|nr:hypothetical protein [Demequina mangrovi]SEI82368.1 hypothetical protein SAMN05421637_0109 [Demequina mangrovi]
MTTIDEPTAMSTTPYGADASTALPLWPWNALRPATGMLLDSDDFEVLGGNPRAKHMLHQSWQHGRGVVWGLAVARHGEWELRVSRGLAVDALGRELHVDAPWCVDLRDALKGQLEPDCGPQEIELCLVLTYDACLARPVPALADPCDVTRESQSYSRVHERARLALVPGHPGLPRTYHRVRVLLGLDKVGKHDDAGKEALAQRYEVLAAEPAHRARELLRGFRCLAARDAADLTADGSDCEPGLFPTPEAHAGVVLGCVRVTVRSDSDHPAIVDGKVCIDDCCRPTLIPTTVIQDLVCGLAPGLIGSGDTRAAVGPQAVPGSIAWVDDESDGKGRHRRSAAFTFAVTEHLLPATLTMTTVTVNSLSKNGWAPEGLETRPTYDPDTRRVTVELSDRPRNPLIRVVVTGTGPTPVYGASPRAPLAGVLGDDPGLAGQGKDAVLTAENPRGGDDGAKHEPADMATMEGDGHHDDHE